MSTTRTDRTRTLPPPTAGDPLLAARLARLDNRRTAPTNPGPRTAPPAPPAPPLATTRTAPRPGPRPPASTPPTARRRHPAKGSRAAALVMSIGTTAGLTAYFYQADSSAASGTGAATTATALTPSVVVVPTTPATVAPTVAPAVGAAPAATAAPVTTTANTVAAAPAPPANALADGTFIGQTFTNRWGPVQVQVVIAGGQITDVAALQTPGGHSRSIQINDIAAPRLRTEALAAQSAQIHTVSGATYTSNGYRQSLQSALDVAKAQATANAG